MRDLLQLDMASQWGFILAQKGVYGGNVNCIYQKFRKKKNVNDIFPKSNDDCLLNSEMKRLNVVFITEVHIP